jgi:hypothetical protein
MVQGGEVGAAATRLGRTGGADRAPAQRAERRSMRGNGRGPARSTTLLPGHPDCRQAARAFLLAGLFFLAGLGAAPARAEVRVEISLEPEAIPAGETAVLAVTVTGASSVDQGPDIPDTPGLSFRSAGRSTSISIVNGRMTQSIAWNYLVLGEKPGQYTIGPVEVREKAKVYRSGTTILSVADAGASGAGSGGQGGGAGGAGGAPRPSRSGPGAVIPAPEDLDPAAGDVFARSSVDRDRVLMGEQVTLRFQVWVPLDMPVLDSQVADLPSTEGFWREDLPPQRTSATNVRGRPYQLTEFAFALFPTRTGRLEIGEGDVDLVIQDRRGGRRSIDPFGFFGSYQERRVRLRSKPLAVRVDALPEPRPGDFTGGVGSFTLKGTLERTETGQNEPLTLVLTVEGTGNVSTVGDPRLPEMPGVRTYPSGSEVQSSRDGDQLRGVKTFRLVLVPESTGRKEVPPIGLSIFDPREHRFVRLETPVLSYTVTTSTAPSGGAGEVARTGRDLRTIRTGGSLDRIGAAEPWRSRGFWLLQGIPVLLLAAGLGLRARRQRREADWGGFLSRGAPGRLRRELASIGAAAVADPGAGYGRLEMALDRYFTDRFHLPVRGLTREELTAELARQGVGEDGIAAVRTLCDRCDFARFAPTVRTEVDLRELLEAARDLPVRLDPEKSLLGKVGRDRRAGKGPRSRPSATGLGALAIAAGAILGAGAASLSSASAATAAGDDRSEVSVVSGRNGARAAMARGHQAYGLGDYAAALAAYQTVLGAGYESPELYLGLGNASYRAGRLGWAVYWFERGRRLAPGDKDLGTNLESVLAETRDRTVGEDGSRFLGGLTALQDRVSTPAAARGLTAAWLLFAAWLAVRLALSGGPVPGLEASRPYRLGGVVLGGFLALSAAGVLVKLAQASGVPTAVVLADELPVRSNPDPEATVEFTLHAGTRVRLGRTSGSFHEVLYSGKLHGWGSADGLASLSDGGVREAALRQP